MAVVHAEDLQFGPLIRRNPRCLGLWLNHVQNDGNSVLVGLAHRAYVGVGGEGLHRAECFGADLARLEEGKRALRLILL